MGWNERKTADIFAPFVSVSTNGMLAIPLLDAETAGTCCLAVGPLHRRNAFRWFCKMPEMMEAEALPTPMGRDRTSITFEPLMLVLDSPLPPHMTACITRTTRGKEVARVKKVELHKWKPAIETGIYPVNIVEAASMRPGEIIEFEGVSWWYSQKEKGNKRHFLPPERLPEMRTRMPVSLRLLMKLRWLPLSTANRNIRIVDGDPLRVAQPISPIVDNWEYEMDRPGPGSPFKERQG